MISQQGELSAPPLPPKASGGRKSEFLTGLDYPEDEEEPEEEEEEDDDDVVPVKVFS